MRSRTTNSMRGRRGRLPLDPAPGFLDAPHRAGVDRLSLEEAPQVVRQLAGRCVTPSLTELEKGEPKMTTDFRGVYAAVLEAWLGLKSRDALAGAFEPMPLFKA